jgi:hypothetical protein
MMRPLLFANKAKRTLLKHYDKNYFNNVVDDSKKNFGHIKQIQLNLGELLCNPEEYMRYFCKLKEKCVSETLYLLYLPFGAAIFAYCKASIFVKYRLFRKKDA